MRHAKSLERLAKFLDYILGRKPDEFGLVPDNEGFIKIKDLLKALSEEEGWKHVRRSHLNEVLITLKNPPIELSGQRIRAKNRDQLPVPVPADTPPKLLYTCIRRRAYPVVSQNGISPASYPKVILSSEKTLAERMGKRIDPQPVMLTVHVSNALKKQMVFHKAGEAIYLSEAISPDCFSGPPLPKETQTPKKEEEKPKRQMPPEPGSFLMGVKSGRNADNRGKQDASGKKHRSKSKKQKRQRPPWRS